MVKKSLIFLPLLLIAFALNARADVTCACLGYSITLKGDKATINSDFDGAIIVTMPDGDILLLEAGDQVPEIPSGAVVEVFDGEMTIQGKNAFALSCGSEVGELIAKVGSVQVVDQLQQMTMLQAGDSLKLTLSGLPAQIAAPTAALDQKGSSIDDLREPDSRNMAQSPSQ